MNLTPWRKPELERDMSFPVQFQEWVDALTFNNTLYPLSGLNQTLKGDREEIGSDYLGLASGAFKQNPVVFACMEVRRAHFSEARFAFRQRVNGKPGDLFGTNELAMLETPWPGGTTGDLLARMIQDVDLAGNFYATRAPGKRIARLRPDWVAILLGSSSRREEWVAGDPDTDVLGYIYAPGGFGSGHDLMVFAPEDVCHFAPIPDPQAQFRGMSWLTPLIREIQSDSQMTTHKTKFLENGATPNMIVKIPEGVTRENFRELVETIKQGHEGARNAHKTLFLAGGADATVVGANFQQLDFKSVQGAGETRIAAAAGTPPVIVGLSEGLQGSSLNAGNYQSARRRFADGTMRPLWRNAAGSMSRLIAVPGGAELWYDDRDIAFLQEDMKDRAEVQQLRTISIKTLIDAGFQPDSAIQAVVADDLSRLSHTGLFSVQLQPAGGQLGEGKGALVSGTIVPSKNGTTSPATT